MKKAKIYVNAVPAGYLTEIEQRTNYTFTYFDHYVADTIITLLKQTHITGSLIEVKHNP